jgi:MFS family permease
MPAERSPAGDSLLDRALETAEKGVRPLVHCRGPDPIFQQSPGHLDFEKRDESYQAGLALRWRLSLLMFLYYAIQGAFVPLFSLRLKELGLTPLEMGWACATQALATLVAPLVAGQVADRWFPAERCLAICSLLSAVLLWVLADLVSAAAIFTVSLALWLVLGPASTLCTALSFAHLAQHGRQFGPIRLWGTVGWVMSGWLVGYRLSQPAWLDHWATAPISGLADAFRIAALLAFTLSAYALTLPHTPPQRRLGDWLAPLAAMRLLGDPPFAVFWLCLLGVCVTLPFTTQVTPLLLAHLGIPRPWISPTLTLGQSMEIVSLALLPMLLLRLGVRRTMLLGLAAWALLLVILWRGEPVWLVVASLSLNGLCICCFIVAGQVFANGRARADVRVSVQALLNVTSGLGLLAGNLLVGWVRLQTQEEFPATFRISAVIAGALLFIFYLGFRAC